LITFLEVTSSNPLDACLADGVSLLFFALMKLAVFSTKRWQCPFYGLSDTPVKLSDLLWIKLVSSE